MATPLHPRPSSRPFRTRGRACRAVLQVERLEDRRLLAASTGLAAYGQLPLRFEVNDGQADAAVRFLARGPGYGLFLTPGEAVLSLHKPPVGGPPEQDPAAPDVLRLRLVGANPDPALVGLDEFATRSNYLLGNDPAHWHSGVANYGRVAYQGVYPGIDLVYYGSQQQLEYDFVVAPGADPRAVRLSFAGAGGMELNGQGDLVLHTAGGDVVEQAPVLYQESAQGRQPVAGRYVLDGAGEVGFAVGAFDRSRPLVIDPILSYATYLGGNGTDYGNGIAVDGAGNAYVTGYTDSTNFPTFSPFQSALGGQLDAFVAKLNAAGSALVYATYLGGSGTDYGNGIAVDGAGSAYVTGSTYSTNFPTASAIQPALGGQDDAFVAKLNATGSALVYSTYLGGGGNDYATGIAVDGTGSACVTGSTFSTNFPTANAIQPAYGGGGAADAFVAKLNTAGSALVYSTYLGGSSSDYGTGIAVDGAGSAYVTGYTFSTNFPTASPFQPASGGSSDVYVAKLNAAGSTLVYATYLGGSAPDYAYAIAVDGAGSAYVTGYTASTNFPTASAIQPALGGGSYDAFVAKLNAAGSALVYATYLGGSGNDYGTGIAVDGAGSAYVTGYTSSTNFPTATPVQPALGGSLDAFVAKLNTAGTALVYATYLGGSGIDYGYGIAVDSTGSAYVTGATYSTNFPTKNALQSTSGGSADAFLLKIATVPLSLFGGTLAAVAAAPFTAPVAFLVDNRFPASPGNFSALVQWGDGSTSSASFVALAGGLCVVAGHTYATEGSYALTVMVQSADGSAVSATATAVVADAPLRAFGRTLSAVEATATSGVVASFRDNDPSGIAGQYTAVIDWGDGGPTSPGAVSVNGAGFDVSGTHTYASHGTYPIQVTLTDPGGALAVAQSSSVVSFTALVGHPKALSVFGNLNFSGAVATFNDPDPRKNPARYQATITWPDNQSTSAGVVTGSNPFTVTGSHTFAAFPGTLTLKVVVVDLDSPGRSVTILSRVADPPAPQAHRAYVAQLYQDLLGRPADDAGVAFWAGLLDNGAANAWVAGQLLASPESRAHEVRQLFATYLHRDADPAGLSAFTAYLLAGGTLEQAQALLVGSAEYVQQRGSGTASGFVDALYEDALSRPADLPGREAFEHALTEGVPASRAAALFFGSAEYRQHRVQGWYQGLLHRDADPAGQALFAAALGDGATDEAVLAALAGSDEYFNAVELPTSF